MFLGRGGAGLGCFIVWRGQGFLCVLRGFFDRGLVLFFGLVCYSVVVCWCVVVGLLWCCFFIVLCGLVGAIYRTTGNIQDFYYFVVWILFHFVVDAHEDGNSFNYLPFGSYGLLAFAKLSGFSFFLFLPLLWFFCFGWSVLALHRLVVSLIYAQVGNICVIMGFMGFGV